MVDFCARHQAVSEKLAAIFPGVMIETDRGGLPTIVAPRDRYLEIIHTLRENESLNFTILAQVSGVHYPNDAEPFEVITRLVSLSLPGQVAVKVRAVNDSPTVPSLAAFWQAANWHEREVFDMFGVRFEGHPDLRRIFLEDDATFHPLRKEFPTEGFEEEG